MRLIAALLLLCSTVFGGELPEKLWDIDYRTATRGDAIMRVLNYTEYPLYCIIIDEGGGYTELEVPPLKFSNWVLSPRSDWTVECELIGSKD